MKEEDEEDEEEEEEEGKDLKGFRKAADWLTFH